MILQAVAAEADRGSSTPLWLSLVTLAVALVAALGSVISGVMTTRRESSSWARDERLKAYRRLTDALEHSYGMAFGDPVETALLHPNFDGLNEARRDTIRQLDEVERAARDLTYFGSADTTELIDKAIILWRRAVMRACPVYGCEHEAAQRQRVQMRKVAAVVQDVVRRRVREDLGSDPQWRRRSLGAKAAHDWFWVAKYYESYVGQQLDQARETLVEWRVRAWNLTGYHDPEDAPYETSDYPWATLQPQINQTALLQPLVAVCRKQIGSPFLLAVQAGLSEEQQRIVERDVVRLVTTHADVTNVSPGWVDGEIDGERIYYWPASLVAAAAGQVPFETDLFGED